MTSPRTTWPSETWARLKAVCVKSRDHLWSLISKAYSPWHPSLATLSGSGLDQRTIDQFVAAQHRELNMVAISSAIVASTVSALFSWSWFPEPPYPTKVAMLCALLQAIMATAVATQQSVALSRASAATGGNELVLKMILGFDSHGNTPADVFPIPKQLRFFVWQTPTMLLGGSIVFILVGLAIALFSFAREAARWGPEAITAMSFSICLLFNLACYLISWFCIDFTIQNSYSAENSALSTP